MSASQDGAMSLPPPRQVLIWHSLDLPTTPYMYEMVVATLLRGFSAAEDPPKLIYGHGVRRGHEVAFQRNISLLRRGDAFVWVGYGFAFGATPWIDLGRRGVRRVFYQCEPEHRCASRTVGRFPIDEMWDFAWHNLEACAHAANPPRLRYVPLGATTMFTPPPAPLPLPASDPGPLLFFGNINDGPPRHRCFRELRRLFGSVGDRRARASPRSAGADRASAHADDAQLTNTNQAFDDGRFQKLLRAHAVWLNLHKGCGDAHNPVTFRVSKALYNGRCVPPPPRARHPSCPRPNPGASHNPSPNPTHPLTQASPLGAGASEGRGRIPRHRRLLPSQPQRDRRRVSKASAGRGGKGAPNRRRQSAWYAGSALFAPQRSPLQSRSPPLLSLTAHVCAPR